MTLREKYEMAVNSIDDFEDGHIEINNRFHIQVGEVEISLVEELPDGNFKFYPSKKRSFETVKKIYLRYLNIE